jgi:hypothetical protein
MWAAYYFILIKVNIYENTGVLVKKKKYNATVIPLGKIVEYSASYLRWKNVSEGQTDCAGFGMGRKRSKKVEIYDFFYSDV